MTGKINEVLVFFYIQTRLPPITADQIGKEKAQIEVFILEWAIEIGSGASFS